MLLFLLYIPTWLLALLLWVLLRRHAYKACPWFFAYVPFGVAASVARFVVHNRPEPYYATYWITEAGYCLLGILAMYEVFQAVLGAVPHAWWARFIFPVIFLASTGLSMERTGAAASTVTSPFLYIVIGEIAVRFVQVFVFAGLATLVPILGLRWRQSPFGVAMGFGFYATIMLLTTTRLADIGTRFAYFWGMTSVAAYSVAVLIWIWFFSVPARGIEPSFPVWPLPS